MSNKYCEKILILKPNTEPIQMLNIIMNKLSNMCAAYVSVPNFDWTVHSGNISYLLLRHVFANIRS